MRESYLYTAVAVLIYAIAGISTAAHAEYSEKITTTSPYVNLPRPTDDPRWAVAFSHWDKRADRREVLAAIEIFESLAEDRPDRLETHMWLTRSYHLAAMRIRKKQDYYATEGVAAGDRALAIDPDNIYAGFWRTSSLALLREPTSAEYEEIREFNVQHSHFRELPVPDDDPLWARAMELWDNRLTREDFEEVDAAIAKGKRISDENFKSLQEKGIAVIAIFEKLEKKYPDRIEPKLWLLRAHYWTTQISVNPKTRAGRGKVAAGWGFKALEMEPQNPAANLFTASSLGEYGMGNSIVVITKYSRQMGRQILLLSEEDPNYMYCGFSRYIAAAIAIVGKLAFNVAAFLGFPRELIERITEFSVDTHPDFLPNYYVLGLMYNSLGRKDDARKMFETLINADPTVLKHQEPENRLIQLIAKLTYNDLFK